MNEPTIYVFQPTYNTLERLSSFTNLNSWRIPLLDYIFAVFGNICMALLDIIWWKHDISPSYSWLSSNSPCLQQYIDLYGGKPTPAFTLDSPLLKMIRPWMGALEIYPKSSSLSCHWKGGWTREVFTYQNSSSANHSTTAHKWKVS